MWLHTGRKRSRLLTARLLAWALVRWVLLAWDIQSARAHGVVYRRRSTGELLTASADVIDAIMHDDIKVSQRLGDHS